MDLMQLISQYGFPMAVAAYTLVVVNKTVAENTKATLLLATKIDSIVTKEGK